MWQRLNEDARRAILLAQVEAIHLQSACVENEHLLLGLLVQKECIAAQVLEEFGVSPKEIRQAIEKEGFTNAGSGKGEPKLSPQTKRTLELAAREASRLRYPFIGTEHLLLTLCQHKDGLAAMIMQRHGIDLKSIYTRIKHLSSETPKLRENVQTDPERRQRINTLLWRYLRTEMERNLPIPDSLRALDKEWTEVTQQKETAVHQDEYERAIDLRDEANEIEERFAQIVQDWQKEVKEE